MSEDDTDIGFLRRSWRRAARARLRMELAGISFARAQGHTPEEYAWHLWDDGALPWFGEEFANARTYLMTEVESFRTLYPDVDYVLDQLGDDFSQLTFVNGCLGGWGRDQWATARSVGLRKGHVCRYCREAFRVWSAQLRIDALPEPKPDGTCVLTVRQP